MGLDMQTHSQSLKAHNLKVSTWGTYYVRILEKAEQPQIKSIQQIHKNQKELKHITEDHHQITKGKRKKEK